MQWLRIYSIDHLTIERGFILHLFEVFRIWSTENWMYKMHVSNPLAETALGKFIEHFCRKVAICVFHCAAKYQGELIYKNLIGCPHCAVCNTGVWIGNHRAIGRVENPVGRVVIWWVLSALPVGIGLTEFLKTGGRGRSPPCPPSSYGPVKSGCARNNRTRICNAKNVVG